MSADQPVETPPVVETDSALPFPRSPLRFTFWAAGLVPWGVGLMFVNTVVSTALLALTPWVVGRMITAIQDVAAGRPHEDLRDLFWLLVLVWLVGPALGRCFGFINGFTTPRIRAKINTILFHHTLGQSHRFFGDTFAGALAQRIRRAGDNTQSLIVMLFHNFTEVIVTIAISGALIWTTVPQFGWAFALFTALFLAVTYASARRAVGMIVVVSKTRSRITGRFTDVLANIDVVRGFAAEDSERRGAAPLIHEEYRGARNIRCYLSAMRLMQLFLLTGFMSVLVWVSLGRVQDGTLTAGDMAVLLTVGVQLGLKINTLGDQIIDAFEYYGDVKESLDAVAHGHEITDKPNAPSLVVSGGAIQVRGLGFAYADGRRVFDGFDLSIRAGERIGLAGPSGAGKSSLLKLLTRRFVPASGEILLDGQNVSEVRRDSLNAAIAEVSQSVELFHRSIRDNIRYADPFADQDRVEAAARAARCHEFILDRPQGYDAVVGERGVKLSGGERQRLAIARALLKDAPIILLDEATSALDSESEQDIQEALWQLIQGRTVIAIAHRLSTITRMDRILYMERGRIVEEGPHDALLARNGAYAAMWRRQVAFSHSE